MNKCKNKTKNWALVEIPAVLSHQVADMNNAGDFAAGRRRLPSCADRIIDCDADSCFLLADGATNEGVTGRHYNKNRIPLTWRRHD